VSAEKESTQRLKCFAVNTFVGAQQCEDSTFLLDKNSIVHDIGHLFVAFRTKIPQTKN
jgi:hypothetical protein